MLTVKPGKLRLVPASGHGRALGLVITLGPVHTLHGRQALLQGRELPLMLSPTCGALRVLLGRHNLVGHALTLTPIPHSRAQG